MSRSEQSKIALITGASRGLGRNSALHLAREGWDLIVTYRAAEAEARSLVAEVEGLGRRIVALPLDTGEVSTFEAFAGKVAETLKSWGRDRFDHLLNNAGAGYQASFPETTESEFDRLVNVHLKGVFFLTQKLLPLIADGGRILNVSSGLSRVTFPVYVAYATMKGAIETFTRYLAKELGPRGITVNVIAPGAIETDFGGGAVRDNADMNKMVASITALGRAGVPDDIGPLVVSLFSESTRWVNAQRIEASGGMLL
jgi:NAD(P)-dependent dehydrogenase (short-subunit alcohol dehydrogenase family)